MNTPPLSARTASGNAVHVIFPYRLPQSPGTWVFDDDRFGLHQEPFVCGASEALERIVQRRGLGDRLEVIFSEKPLPEPDAILQRVGTGADPELGGCSYNDGTAQLWLCPAMTHYLGGTTAPATIYLRVNNATASPDRR